MVTNWENIGVSSFLSNFFVADEFFYFKDTEKDELRDRVTNWEPPTVKKKRSIRR